MKCNHTLKQHKIMEEAKASSGLEGAKTNKTVCELLDMAAVLNDSTNRQEGKGRELYPAGWEGFLSWINSLSPWNLWDKWDAPDRKLKPHVARFLNDLLQEAIESERAKLLSAIKNAGHTGLIHLICAAELLNKLNADSPPDKP